MITLELSQVFILKQWFDWGNNEEGSSHTDWNWCAFLLPPPGESVPAEEQFDKEKAKAEVQALDTALNNDKTPPKPALSTLPGVKLTDAEKEKYEAEMAKLYKQLDDKVRKDLLCTSHLQSYDSCSIHF